MGVLRPSPELSLDRTAPYDVAVSRKGNPKTSRDRTAPQPSPTDCVPRPSACGTHPSRNDCSWVSHPFTALPFTFRGVHAVHASRRSTTLASARAGAVAGSAFYRATRGKAGKRLASGVTLSNPLTQPAGTPTPHTPESDPGKGWQKTSLRTRSLQLTHPTTEHTNPPCVTKHYLRCTLHWSDVVCESVE